ncbi:MAG TPA: Bax inhibitor-1/YccA family protein [Rhodospirillales bacterium]|nr:Bax inhibitor-1/YccA family protein [Rhodospirillales bacterium]
MAVGPDRRFELGTRTMTGAQAEAAGIGVGLREYMLRVYNYMALGVALTGVVSMLVAANPAVMQAVVGGPMIWVLFAGILGLGFFAPRVMMTKSVGAAQACFWVYAAMWGALIAPYFYMYTQASIARAFFITAAAFAGMSLYGYTTKKDLTAMGRFLVMASFGILIALVVNIFLQSSGLHLAMSIIVPVVFAGLTAYETQQIKSWYYESDAADVSHRKGIFGAFMLYGSFVTMFIWILQLFGVARSE